MANPELTLQRAVSAAIEETRITLNAFEKEMLTNVITRQVKEHYAYRLRALNLVGEMSVIDATTKLWESMTQLML